MSRRLPSTALLVVDHGAPDISALCQALRARGHRIERVADSGAAAAALSQDPELFSALLVESSLLDPALRLALGALSRPLPTFVVAATEGSRSMPGPSDAEAGVLVHLDRPLQVQVLELLFVQAAEIESLRGEVVGFATRHSKAAEPAAKPSEAQDSSDRFNSWLAGSAPELTLEEISSLYITRVLQYCGGHRSRSAKILGIDRKTLYSRLKKS